MELLLIAIGYIIGIILGLYFNVSIALIFVLIFSFCIVIKKYVIKDKKRNKELNKYLICFVIAIFFSYIQISILETDYEVKYKNIQGKVEIVGTIISEPKIKNNKVSYNLNVESIDNKNFCKNTKILVNIKTNNNNFKYGDKIIIYAELQDASVARNEGGFNYKEYLKTKGIYKTVTAKTSEVKVIKQNNINLIFKIVNDTKNKVKEASRKLLPEKEANFLIGILIGDKDALDEDIQEDFRNSNLSHILAISGMHVSYIVEGISFILIKLKFGKNKSKIITIVFLIFYTLLTGCTPSVTRAAIMSIYMIAGSLIHKKVNIVNSISISAIIILFFNPYNILDIGFQLSFGGTIGIVTIFPVLKKHIGLKATKQNLTFQKIKEKIIDIILVTLSANIILFPIILYHFNTISTVFLISNLLVSPILGIIIFLGFLLILISYICFPISQIIALILKFFINILLQIADILGNIPFSKIYFITPKIYIIIIYYFLILFFILIKNNKIKFKKYEIQKIKIKKIITIALIIIILSNFIINTIIQNNLIIYFIDVGQGDCTLIITPKGKTILIDGGGTETSNTYDVGERVLIPFLLDKQIVKIDYIISTHMDTDHVGGILTVVEKLKVGQVFIPKQGEDSNNYKKFKEIINRKNIKANVVNKGDVLQIENNLYFDILWPNNSSLIQENILNNNSIVCKLNYKNFSILFTGDIEEIAEKQILSDYKNNLQILNSTILKVAHHGSKTSSTKEFLEAVKPRMTLIGVGENNKFGHPNDEIIDRLESFNTKIYRTDKMGQITITVDRTGKNKVKKFIEEQISINELIKNAVAAY